MRLLKREQSSWFSGRSTFNFAETYPQQDCHYAILSHRWGEDEVTYQDIQSQTANTKKGGYNKLEFCAEQAARDGLLYFWVDTCCINKASSAELSEAINSMFKWYQNATKCYVYLSDVSMVGDWESAFQKSKWFTRGWTLQELLAPAVVEFFSKDGHRLGDKRSLEGLICQITGISVEALRGQPLSEIDKKERFSWMSRRKTTVEEDAAYCLLGIFDVHMPLIYGEGEQKALLRLRREIQLSSSLNAFVAHDAPWIVPFERNSRFTGREYQLAQLEGKLFTEDSTLKIAITGLGGVGKTQLVLELLYRTKEKHPACSMIWIPATTAENLHQAYLAAAQQLQLPGYDDKEVDVRRLVQDHLSKEDAGPWLLVFDNADAIDLWVTVTLKRKRVDDDEVSIGCNSSGEPRRLIDCLPQNRRGCIIFTTRDRKVAVTLAQHNVITISEMSEDMATNLLKKSLIRPELVDDRQSVAKLLAALTYLPLAITQAIAYINTKDVTLSDYLSLVKAKEEEAIDILSEDFIDYGRYQDIQNPVATTWLVSFEQIQRSDPLAAEYLSFIASIHPRDIPQALLPLGASRKKELDAIGTLDAYSFINRQPASATFDIHRLVHLATRNWLQKKGLLSHWTKNAIVRLAEVFPSDNHRNRMVWRTYFSHTSRVLASELVSAEEGERVTLLWRYGRCLTSDGRWDEAEKVFTEILTIGRKKSGEESTDVLISMTWLANIYSKQGRWQEAEPLQVRLMETRKTQLGLDCPETATGMGYLALTYWHQGRWQEAEQLQVQVMEIHKTKLGIDHPKTLTSMNNLVTIYNSQGQWRKAEQLEIQVLEAQKTKLGVAHPNTLTSMNNLASIYGGQGRWEEAEQLQVQAMETSKMELGADHPSTLATINNLALTYSKRGQQQEAEQLGIYVLETRTKKLGPTHPDTLTGMNNLARIWVKMGKRAEAVALMEECIALSLQKLGPDHPHTRASLESLARWKSAETE